MEAGRVFEADTYLKAMRGKRALPDAIRKSGLVPGLLPIERIRLRNFQQDSSAAAAVYSRQVLHYSSNGLAVCLPAHNVSTLHHPSCHLRLLGTPTGSNARGCAILIKLSSCMGRVSKAFAGAAK
jgi:hypothetical protein